MARTPERVVDGIFSSSMPLPSVFFLLFEDAAAGVVLEGQRVILIFQRFSVDVEQADTVDLSGDLELEFMLGLGGA